MINDDLINRAIEESNADILWINVKIFIKFL